MSDVVGQVRVLGLYDGKKYDKGVDKSRKKTKDFEAATMSASKMMKKYGASVAAIATGAGVAGGGLVALGNQYANATLQQNRFANALGVATPVLISYQRAASKLNIEQDVMNDALLELSRRSAEATTGTGSMADALKILGLDADRFVKLSLDKQFDLITRSLSKLDSEAQRNFLTDEIFGGASDTISGLLPQLNALAQGMDKVALAAENQRALEFAERFDSISKRFSEVGRNLVIDATPVALEAIGGAEAILEATGVLKSTRAKDAARAAAGQSTTGGGIGGIVSRARQAAITGIASFNQLVPIYAEAGNAETVRRNRRIQQGVRTQSQVEREGRPVRAQPAGLL